MCYMLDFVVDLVEERVDLGDSQFSEQISNAGTLRMLHNRMWVALEFRGPCPPRSPLFSHDSSSHDQ